MNHSSKVTNAHAATGPPRSPGNRSPAILVVDDEAFLREAMELFLQTEGFDVYSAGDGMEALEVLARHSIDVAVLDILMPGMSGLDLLARIKGQYPDVEVVMASGCGTLEAAVESMRRGAYDYVAKPILDFDEDLLKVVKKALERRRLLRTNRLLAADVQEANRELKRVNVELKRHLAEFELLYETGRLLVQLPDLESLLAVVSDLLLEQLSVAQSVLLVSTTDGLTVGCAPGFGETPGPTAPLRLLDAWLPSEPDPGDLDPDQRSTLVSALRDIGLAEVNGRHAILFPLMSVSALSGALVLFLDVPLAGLGEHHRRTIEILTAQIAAPLALVARSEVAR